MRYSFTTRAGTFHIILQRDTRWYTYCEDEYLGDYETAAKAVDDLTGGHTFWPSSGVDPATVGLPSELEDWHRSA